MNMLIHQKHRRVALGVGVLTAGLACADDVRILCAGSDGPEACTAPGPLPSVERPLEVSPSAPADPLFLLGTRVWDDTATTSYFHVLPSLEAGTALDVQRAIEVPGSARVYSAFDLGWFAIGGGEAPLITRYTLDSDNQLVQGASISLQQYGVSDLWETLYFVSPTKAYYPDRAGGQLIVWNPAEMSVTGSIPLPETLRDGYLALYGYAPIWRGDELLISVGWFDWDVNDSVLGETGLIAIDTQTDSVRRFDVDTRCGGVTGPVTLPSGETYLVSSALAGSAHRLGRLSTEPCALRIAAGASQIDSEYWLPLASLGAGALAGEPVPAQAGGMFLRVFDDGLAQPGEIAASWELTGQAAWRWWSWDPAADAALPVSELQPSTADVVWFQVDGRVYGTETTEDYAETTLIELTADGGPRTALTVPGFLHGVTRIR
jgi:hypothetical protein